MNETAPETPKFSIRNLSVLAYANGFTLWHYKPAKYEPFGERGHFDDAEDVFSPGDVVIISGPYGCSIAHIGEDRCPAL